MHYPPTRVLRVIDGTGKTDCQFRVIRGIASAEDLAALVLVVVWVLRRRAAQRGNASIPNLCPCQLTPSWYADSRLDCFPKPARPFGSWNGLRATMQPNERKP